MRPSTFFFWVMMITLTITYFGVEYAHTLQHEAVHKAIFKNYGLDSKIVINNPIKATITGTGGYTRPDISEGQNYSDYCTESCEVLHSQNEIISYNVGTLFLLFYLFMIVMVLCTSTILSYLEKFINRE